MTDILEICGQKISLLPERGAFWHERKTLILSDLHWGKSEEFQAMGVALPSALPTELLLLKQMVQKTGAQRILILGDLMHSGRRYSDSLESQVASWRTAPEIAGVEIVLIKGNHDRFRMLPASWAFQELAEDLDDGPFLFTHAPAGKQGHHGFVWAGHLHPVIELRLRREFVRMPCFVLEQDGMILPSFGLTTGGLAVERGDGRRILAIAGDRIVEI